MIPDQRQHGQSGSPIRLLNSDQQQRVIRLGPFKTNGIELPGTTLIHARGKARAQLAQIAQLYGRRAEGDPIIKVLFTSVVSTAVFDFPGANMRGLYPVNLTIERGADYPVVDQRDGLAKLVLTHLSVKLACKRQDGSSKTISLHARHVILRADGDIRVML